jgi:hypothetical protein
MLSEKLSNENVTKVCDYIISNKFFNYCCIAPTNNGAIKECNRWCVYDYIELVETDKDFDSVGKNAI